jgi:hypothetical protein
MSYITARAVTNGQGHRLAGDLDLSGLKTVDLCAKRETIWKHPVTLWDTLTLQEILDGRHPWLLKYHALAFNLSAKFPSSKLCKIGRKGATSIKIDKCEYRIRSMVVYERKL